MGLQKSRAQLGLNDNSEGHWCLDGLWERIKKNEEELNPCRCHLKSVLYFLHFKKPTPTSWPDHFYSIFMLTFPHCKTHRGDTYKHKSEGRGKKTFHVQPNLLPTASLNISFFGGADVGCNLAQSLRTKMPAPFWKGLISRSHSHLLWNSPMCTYVLLLNSWVCCVCVQKCVRVGQWAARTDLEDMGKHFLLEMCLGCTKDKK